MDWKDDIGKHLANGGIYRLDYNNNLLSGYLEEWAKYLSEFEGIHYHLEDKNPLDDSFIQRAKCILINEPAGFGFRAYLKYSTDESSGEICLKMRYNINLDIDNILEARGRDDDRLYLWINETFSEPEIFEQGYILQLLNARFKKFNDLTKFFRAF